MKLIDKKGQTAIYDALLFFIVMTIASAVVVATTFTFLKQNPEYLKSERNIQFANDVLDSVLISSINKTFYKKGTETFYIYQQTTENIIRFYLELKSENQGYDLSQLKSNITIKFDTATNNSMTSKWNYALYGEYLKGSTLSTIFISNKITSISQLPAERYSSVKEIQTIGAVITLYVWK